MVSKVVRFRLRNEQIFCQRKSKRAFSFRNLERVNFFYWDSLLNTIFQYNINKKVTVSNLCDPPAAHSSLHFGLTSDV